MKKRGISAVVATILIILIVVVGVGIVWKVVLPLFAELEFLSYSDVRLNIVFQGHTVYDSNQNFAFVQIERGKDEVNMTGIEIGFNFDGTTKTYQSKKVPTPNGKYTYKFNFTNDSDMGIPQNVTPDKVTVAPIFTINNKVRLGKILDEKPMPVGRIHLSVEEWVKANEDAATPIVVTTGSGGGDEPGEPVDPVDPVVDWITLTGCAVLNESGNYRLEGNILVDELSDYNDKGEGILLWGECFAVTANDVTFDLNGHTLSSTLCPGRFDPADNYCVSAIAVGSVVDVSNFNLINGIITGFGTGISLGDVSGGSVSSVVIDKGKNGIYGTEISDVTFSDISILNLNHSQPSCDFFSCHDVFEDVGLALSNSEDNLIENLFIQNVSYCLDLSGGTDNEISNVDASCRVESFTIDGETDLTFSNADFSYAPLGGFYVIINGLFPSSSIYSSEGLSLDRIVSGYTSVEESSLNINNGVFCGEYSQLPPDGMGPPATFFGLRVTGNSDLTINNVSCTNYESNEYCDADLCPDPGECVGPCCEWVGPAPCPY